MYNCTYLNDAKAIESENIYFVTLFETENERQKTKPVPIPLPRASSNFADVKTRNEKIVHT